MLTLDNCSSSAFDLSQKISLEALGPLPSPTSNPAPEPAASARAKTWSNA